MPRAKVPKWIKIVEVLCQLDKKEVSPAEIYFAMPLVKTTIKRTDFSVTALGRFMHSWFGHTRNKKYYINERKLIRLAKRALHYVDSKPIREYLEKFKNYKVVQFDYGTTIENEKDGEYGKNKDTIMVYAEFSKPIAKRRKKDLAP